ncbi:MAG: aspartyl-phosphate phosphatase Spo0E family protein [Paenibacillaceae bacterium]
MEFLDSTGQLAKDIELNREQLLSLGAYYGINDPKVLDASRELDQLILRYYKSIIKKTTLVP